MIKLTRTDEMILASYPIFMEGLASYFGSSFEYVLHRLDNLDHSVYQIINGYHSNREVGSPITDYSLEQLNKVTDDIEHHFMTHSTTSPTGEPIRSVTIPIVGERNRIIGMACINFYLSSSVSSFLNSFASVNNPVREGAAGGHVSETFAARSEDLIYRALEEARQRVNADTSIAVSNKNRAIINELCEKGIFNLKDAVAIVSKTIGLTKNTVYLYIRQNRRE